MSPCIPIGNGIVTVGGPTIRIATSAGTVAFEWHDYLGPMPISLKRGCEGEGRNLSAGHPFWSQVTRWCEQGRVVRDGWAVVERTAETESP